MYGCGEFDGAGWLDGVPCDGCGAVVLVVGDGVADDVADGVALGDADGVAPGNAPGARFD